MSRPVARLCCLPLLLLICTQNAVQGQTIFINFDILTANSSLTEGAFVSVNARLSSQFFSTYGVRFRSQANYVAVVPLGSGHATSAPNGIAGVTSSNTVDYSNTSPITISFFDPANPSVQDTTDFVSIRGDLLGGNGELTTLQAFDVSGNLIATDTEMDTGGQTYQVSVAGIKSVRFSGVNNATGGGIALDDLTFHKATAVPETGTVALLVGIITVSTGVLRKRRNR